MKKFGDKITCPECGKEIGVLVLHNIMTVKGIGNIPCYDQKHDFRKAARIGFGSGYLCKGCARKYFPEGVAYKVTVAYGHGRVTPFIGIKHKGLFATEEEAREAAKDMGRRSNDNDPKIERITI